MWNTYTLYINKNSVENKQYVNVDFSNYITAQMYYWAIVYLGDKCVSILCNFVCELYKCNSYMYM